MITIIIVCHNQLASTKRTINSLLKYKNNTPYHLYLIDNGSTDNTFQYFSSLTVSKTIFQYSENTGFIIPNNHAIQDTTTDVLLLNNDIEILSDHWLDRLVEDSLPDDIGLSYPLNRTRNQLFYGGIIQNRQESLLNYNIDKLQTPTWAQFSCVLIKRKVIDDIGFLDSFNFAYFEDVDYCVRLTIKGYKMKLVKDVVVEHYQSVTAKTVKHEQYRIENRDKFYKKWNDRF